MRVPELSEVEQADGLILEGRYQYLAQTGAQLTSDSGQYRDQLADDLRIPRWQDAAVREGCRSDKTYIHCCHDRNPY